MIVMAQLDSRSGSACRLCGIRNCPPEDGLILLELRKQLMPEKDCYGPVGYVSYCVECYEKLREMAIKDDFNKFPPCFSLDYMHEITFDFPDWLNVDKHDAMKLWRKKVDVQDWKQKLAADRE